MSGYSHRAWIERALLFSKIHLNSLSNGMNSWPLSEHINVDRIQVHRDLMGKQANLCFLKSVIENPESSICSRNNSASFCCIIDISMRKPLEQEVAV